MRPVPAVPLVVVSALLALLTIISPARGVTWIVDPDGTGDLPNIQAAIFSAQDGDVVELTNGVFTGPGNRNIDFVGKAIAVRSASHEPKLCIIDAEYASRGLHFHSGEGPGSMLLGVTVTHGYASYGGGILFENGSSPTLEKCVITHNAASASAGLDCNNGSSPRIIDCEVTYNSASGYSGGISFTGEPGPFVTGTTFAHNSAGTGGGAVLGTYGSSPIFQNCTFVYNQAPEGAGVHLRWSSAPILDNCIIAFNTGAEAVFCNYGGYATLSCTDVFANEGGDWVGCIADQYGTNGNISEEPLFCDPGTDDFGLHVNSPCAPFTYPNEDCDLIGAWPVTCGTATTGIEFTLKESTWGGIKLMYR